MKITFLEYADYLNNGVKYKTQNASFQKTEKKIIQCNR